MNKIKELINKAAIYDTYMAFYKEGESFSAVLKGAEKQYFLNQRIDSLTQEVFGTEKGNGECTVGSQIEFLTNQFSPDDLIIIDKWATFDIKNLIIEGDGSLEIYADYLNSLNTKEFQDLCLTFFKKIEEEYDLDTGYSRVYLTAQLKKHLEETFAIQELSTNTNRQA